MKTRSHTSDNPKMAVKGYADGGKVPLPPTRPVAAASPKEEEEKRKPKVTVEGGASGFSPSKGVDIVSGGGRVGVAIPVGKGEINAGVSGIGNSVRAKTPGGTFKHNSAQFSGIDVGYSRGGMDVGASYSTMPDETGKQDKRIMFTLNKSF